MFKVYELTEVQADRSRGTEAYETAVIVATGVMIHAGLATEVASRERETHLLPLTSVGEEHTYRLTVSGYRVEQFLDIAKAYAKKDFQEAERLIKQLSRPGKKG